MAALPLRWSGVAAEARVAARPSPCPAPPPAASRRQRGPPRMRSARLRRSPWLLVAGSLGAERWRLVPVAAALLLGTLLPLAGPQLVARFVDEAVGGAPVEALLALGAAYLAVALAGQVAAVAASATASGAAWRVTNRLRERVAAHALGLDMDYHGRHTPGEMIERVDGDLLGLTQF